MKPHRAKEIFESADRIEVKLDGTPVWIEKVDVDNGVATVQVGQSPTDVQTVGVERLTEGE
ncbi:H-type small acid-soluble spore protein [Paenibacillaceae bacterium WGS1546]|uniref:H-type small acid-soluble spore protein n=1 Tax=Cohnella sp. WGS1546 TaxID=3366810 RepID=UPI00372D3E92